MVARLVKVPPPASGDVVRFRSLSQLFDNFLGGFFCPNEQDVPTFGRGFAQKISCFPDLLGRAREIDDINSVARAKDELLHLGVPFVGAVSKVNPCLEESFHL